MFNAMVNEAHSRLSKHHVETNENAKSHIKISFEGNYIGFNCFLHDFFVE